MCLGTKAEPSAAVAVDSGLVDVNTALGLNLGTKDRVKFRRRSTCGVLPLEGHTTVKKETDLPSEFLGTKTLPGAGKSKLKHRVPSCSLH